MNTKDKVLDWRVKGGCHVVRILLHFYYTLVPHSSSLLQRKQLKSKGPHVSICSRVISLLGLCTSFSGSHLCTGSAEDAPALPNLALKAIHLQSTQPLSP